MVEPPKQTLVNGKPVEDEDPDETTDSTVDQGSGDLHGEGATNGSEEQAGTGARSGSDSADETQTIPTSKQEIKERAKGVVERLRRDGPEPVRRQAKGLVDKAFDAIDAGFDRWFGDK